MQIWAESGKSALPICNYSQILYQFLAFTQNLKRSRIIIDVALGVSLGMLLTGFVFSGRYGIKIRAFKQRIFKRQ